MPITTGFDGSSPFRIKRPLITSNGFVSAVDPTVKGQLNELDALLGKRIFRVKGSPKPAPGRKASQSNGHQVPAAESSVYPPVAEELQRVLTARHTPPISFRGKKVAWAHGSLAQAFADAPEPDGGFSLSDYIDMTGDLASLKYAFESNLTANWFNLDANTKTVLDGYASITNYLVAYAFVVMNVEDVNGLKNFILSNRLGARAFIEYAVVSAARQIVDEEQLKVPEVNDEQESRIIGDLKKAGLSLSSASFRSGVQALINDYVFNAKEAQLIDDAGLGAIPPSLKPQLIKFIRTSPVPITKDNVKFFLPMFIAQSAGPAPVEAPAEVDTDQADKDFDVEFLQDDSSQLQISRSAVKCSSQLYYSMILGDELNVFDIVSYFTHKYLVRGGIEIQDSRLREDLQAYVFSNRFTDLKTLKVVDRTRPAERQMFYRQVFNYGSGQITDDVIVNDEFPRLWKVLVLESAKYLERAQAAFNPDSYVSRQNVMQAVEDLQYNLSTHCTGMANVITPMIYGELNFVIQRILMNKEILRQVVPAGGTWWRVVETLYMGMKNVRPKATVLYNKAKLGHDILRSVADYNPATFEDDVTFSAFISTVDAFITTQSILQDALTDDLKKGTEEETDGPRLPTPRIGMPDMPMPPLPPGLTNGSGAKAGSEWDF